nr:hypothetical protein [Tanacetum cinerariifolium]
MVQRQSMVVRHRRPSLTPTVDRRSPPLTGGPVMVNDGPAAVNGAAEKSVRGSGFSTRFSSEKSVQGSEKKSILEADVAQCNWWIKNNTAANDEI